LPALMNPCSPPQSVPLLEGICRTISDMNADQMMVTQKTLVEQLVKSYPGIAVPSDNILYNILGALIKERKIYHTGEGYFIVTPNTYFSTKDATEDNKKEGSCRSLSSTIYLVNTVSCAGLVKENIPQVSSHRSCCRFPDQTTLCEQRLRQLMNREPKVGGKKGCSELKPSIQAQVISSSAENHSWDTVKSLTSVREKLKCKRFGLGLFWRSTSKKEKHKKEYSTFSAQFPPREWPVRDEDDLDNIPRDIEHEIIRRINPTLTVDNLIKHTILMQKFEDRKKYTSKSTSAEALTLRQKHLAKECVPKTRVGTAKQKRKTKSNKEKKISRSNRKSHMHEPTSPNQKLEDNISLPITNQLPLDAAEESQVIYKKQIKNPFQGLSWRQNFHAKAYKSHISSQLKSRTRKQESGLQRPQSMGSPEAFEYEAEQQVAEMQADSARQNKSHQADRLSVQLKEDGVSENITYPQSNILQVDDNCKHFLESNISKDVCRGTVERNPVDIQKSLRSYTEDNGVCNEAAKYSLRLKGRYKAGTVCELLDQTASEFQNVHLSNYTTNVSRVKEFCVKYRQNTGKKNEPLFKCGCATCPGSMKLESEGFTDKCHLLNQKARDCDTHILLDLDDKLECSEPCQLLPGRAFSGTRDQNKAVQKLGTALKTSKVNICPTQCSTVNKLDSGECGYKESAGLAESTDGSKKHQKTDFREGSCLPSQALPMVHGKEEETGLTECMRASAVADFCHTDEADALQNATCEVGGVGACCALDPQSKETRNPPGKTGPDFQNACAAVSGQNHTEGTENHSITGDSGIDSPR
ncbi:STOX1 protein, partial [Alectura lathami]|nr:STOX1 protein [Alectura lathami]